ncbi:MAG: glutathione S-transferase family protein [Gloeomargarita sp. GMQP_bins_44]
MLKLYGGTRSRAAIVAWYLEELQVPYEFVRLDMGAGDHRQPAYLAINPMGKVPALVDGDVVVWESGAILLYLADKYGQLPPTPAKRAELYQWVLFSNSTLVQALAQPPEKREQELGKLLPPLQQILSDRDYLTGSQLTVADVALASILFFATQMFGLEVSPYPAIAAYLQRCQHRAAFQKAMTPG